jgi:DNA-binding transcriptional regulator YiaG
VTAWETGRLEPKVSYIPRIVAFLGYDPFAGAATLGERLRAERRRRGLSQAQAAHKLGIANTTFRRLEAGRESRDERVLGVVQEFLAG